MKTRSSMAVFIVVLLSVFLMLTTSCENLSAPSNYTKSDVKVNIFNGKEYSQINTYTIDEDKDHVYLCVQDLPTYGYAVDEFPSEKKITVKFTGNTPKSYSQSSLGEKGHARQSLSTVLVEGKKIPAFSAKKYTLIELSSIEHAEGICNLFYGELPSQSTMQSALNASYNDIVDFMPNCSTFPSYDQHSAFRDNITHLDFCVLLDRFFSKTKADEIYDPYVDSFVKMRTLGFYKNLSITESDALTPITVRDANTVFLNLLNYLGHKNSNSLFTSNAPITLENALVLLDTQGSKYGYFKKRPDFSATPVPLNQLALKKSSEVIGVSVFELETNRKNYSNPLHAVPDFDTPILISQPKGTLTQTILYNVSFAKLGIDNYVCIDQKGGGVFYGTGALRHVPNPIQQIDVFLDTGVIVRKTADENNFSYLGGGVYRTRINLAPSSSMFDTSLTPVSVPSIKKIILIDIHGAPVLEVLAETLNR